MRFRRCISELYVDIMLTLVVISVSSMFTALFSGLSNNLSSDYLVSIGKPPLAVIIKYGVKNYLLVANYEDSSKEVLLISNGIIVGNYLVGPQEVLVVEVNDVDGIYVLVGKYLIKPNYVDMR